MYEVHDVLHRDVFLHKIVWNPDGTPGGMLIDFDLAIGMKRTASTGAMHRTGTFDFMAMQVLRPPLGHLHTPLHDLESFFYVLLYVCIYYDNNGKRRKPSPTVTMFAEPQPKDDRF
jgi:hypothetical protein